MTSEPIRWNAPAPPAGAAAPPRRPRVWLRRTGLALGLLVLALLVALGAGALWARSQLLASLPDVEGRLALPGLAAPVSVERDALGVPAIRGASRLDVARATGFVHAQDRFFQMDLMLRRRAAGEVAALVGPRGLERDREVRIHRLRAHAEAAYRALPAAQRELLDAYAAGVNAGLAALEAPPFEYLLLRADPEPWRPEDSLLAVFAMYLELQTYTMEHETNLGFLQAMLPPDLFAFLSPVGTDWDAPMTGGVYDGSDFAVLTAGVPAPATHLPAPPPPAAVPSDGSERIAGSNAWAVAPEHTAAGAALLANDMHLPLSVPSLWYRAAFEWPGAGGRRHRVTGITLPGLPLLIAGSNGRVAWGFTSSLIDTSDIILLEPAGDGAYRTPAGPRPYRRHEEVIAVRGAAPERLEVLWTEWGPVLPDDRLGRPRAVAWVAHREGAVNLAARGLETAASLEEALAVARRAGAPAQNIVAADAAGHIGWTIFGAVPHRIGFAGRLPGSWSDGGRRWEGLVPPERVPALVDPPGGRVWNANNRTVDGEALAVLGDGGYRSGARARQIRDALFALDEATADDMRALQMDDRALFLERWKDLLLEDVLTPEAVAGNPRRAEFRRQVAAWEGRAAVDSVAFRLVRAYRLVLAQELFDHLTRELREKDPSFGLLRYPHFEEPLWALVTERPPQLLDPRFASWHERLVAGVDDTLALIAGQSPDVPLESLTWGSVNTTDVRHPLSGALPMADRWLDMPDLPMRGAEEMPLAQRPDYGASMRLVVSPGHEEAGTLVIPMGQSGHPLSPHYTDAHDEWAEGEPLPLLPGPPVHTLVLGPAPPAAS
ncbi:MAG TPA: penicillin acylase family protein [Thermoanaerobaculia bacterium]|nr:penicillin acylase family protein [Thermoanaerobaculia bacterium]